MTNFRVSAGFLAAMLGVTAFAVSRFYFNPTCSQCSPFAKDVAETLQQQPGRWRRVGAWLKRDDGLELWVANGPAYLGSWQLRANDDWKTNFPFGSREQRHVWAALERWNEDRQEPLQKWNPHGDTKE